MASITCAKDTMRAASAPLFTVTFTALSRPPHRSTFPTPFIFSISGLMSSSIISFKDARSFFPFTDIASTGIHSAEENLTTDGSSASSGSSHFALLTASRTFVSAYLMSVPSEKRAVTEEIFSLEPEDRDSSPSTTAIASSIGLLTRFSISSADAPS
ncbi:MAG: hypothetical protein BWY84_00195 [Candidatus Aerophobetes bacterium ADurb.Bin490]|nr:MAG: hypothetical protein BWY84_00195 [Candidatus Aerophobetes bacterium ADurb.Bin490]